MSFPGADCRAGEAEKARAPSPGFLADTNPRLSFSRDVDSFG